MVDTRLVEDHGREPDLLMLDSRFVSRGPDFGGDIGNNEFIKVDEPSNTVYPLRSVDRGGKCRVLENRYDVAVLRRIVGE